MYSLQQLVTGLQHPSAAKRELSYRWQQARSYLPHDIGIQGSYHTGNIGDQAIGRTLTTQFSDMGLRTRSFGKQIEHSNAPLHILGGGGVLHDWYGTDHLRHRLKFVSDGGAAIGVGVPGFSTTTGRELIRSGLSDVRLITVRDEWSRKRLEPYYDGPLHVTACPTLIRQDPEKPLSHRTGVNFRRWFHIDSNVLSEHFDYDDDIDLEKENENYLQNIRRICNAVEDPVYIPFHKRDERFAEEYLDIEILPYTFSDQATLERVSAVEKMVCMRYHSLVFAIICNKPVIPIAYEPKVSQLANRVGVSSYLPHEHIPLHFEQPENREAIKRDAMKNFSLLSDTYSI